MEEFLHDLREWRRYMEENKVRGKRISETVLKGYQVKCITGPIIVSSSERSRLIEWLKESKNEVLTESFETAKWGYVKHIKDVAPNMYEIIQSIKQRIIDREGITLIWHKYTSCLPDFINYCDVGSQVYIHTDLDDVAHDDSLIHVRYNVMLSRGEGLDGMPTVINQIYDVTEGCYYCNLASEDLHGSTPIRDEPRIGISFGFIFMSSEFFKDRDIEHLLSDHKNRKMYYMQHLEEQRNVIVSYRD